jgi:aldehyde dehydrogenase
MKCTAPGQDGSMVAAESRYENFIGGKWLPPVSGRYRVNLSPATARPICAVRETHQMMLEHYSQTKNLLVSYDPKPMGLF